MSEDNNSKKTTGEFASSKNIENSNRKQADDKKITEPASSTAKQILVENIGKQQPEDTHIEPLQTEAAKHYSKKWSHYLFDFIMLFLAVSAGFFVDNKREVYMERQRANQFAKQLLADLRLDSLLFEQRNRDIQSLQVGFDKLLSMLIQDTAAENRQVLETLLPLAYVFDLPATATTYNQMKSSGALRYIENQELTAHLQDYYDVLLPRSINIAQVSLDFYSQNISPYYLAHIRIQDYDSFNDTLINKNPVIMDRTKQTDQALANIMGSYRALLKIQVITMNNPALHKIIETMKLLQNEYMLE